MEYLFCRFASLVEDLSVYLPWELTACNNMIYQRSDLSTCFKKQRKNCFLYDTNHILNILQKNKERSIR
jgi:hypothetical protein